MIKLTVHGETPAKKNSKIITCNHRIISSNRYRQWHQGATAEIMTQCRVDTPIDYQVIVRLFFYHGDLRRRDSDNGTSSILDLLTDCRILLDDNWNIVKFIEVRNYYDKNNARCDIEIEKVYE